MTDDLARITADDQAHAYRREQRTFAEALAGDVAAYHDALKGAGLGPELLAVMVPDFNRSWLAYSIGETELNVALMYAEADDE